jgi:hypothetical protein
VIIPLKPILVNKFCGQCLLFYLAAKNVKHLLSQCSATKNLWRELKLADLIRNILGID